MPSRVSDGSILQHPGRRREAPHQKIDEHGHPWRPEAPGRRNDVEPDRWKGPIRHHLLETPSGEVLPDNELGLDSKAMPPQEPLASAHRRCSPAMALPDGRVPLHRIDEQSASDRVPADRNIPGRRGVRDRGDGSDGPNDQDNRQQRRGDDGCCRGGASSGPSPPTPRCEAQGRTRHR